jgi:hypothetical protein
VNLLAVTVVKQYEKCAKQSSNNLVVHDQLNSVVLIRKRFITSSPETTVRVDPGIIQSTRELLLSWLKLRKPAV